MATVIIGAGVIGTATAYYLSELVSDPSTIHLVEASPTLYAAASGYAGGFLAEDWFAPGLTPLGVLSFKLHKELAEKNDGLKKWGYLPSTALSLGIEEDIGVGGRQRGEDWLLQGTSRANAATPGDFLNADGTPAWLTKQKGGTLDIISSEDGCAQVDPSQLCHFLLSECQKRGVQLYQPATVTAINTTEENVLESVTITSSSEGAKPLIIPTKAIILSAGPWTPRVFSALFQNSKYKVPISSLAGHSLLLRSPRHDPSSLAPTTEASPTLATRSHAIFCAPSSKSAIPFAPELFSRANGEIYIAGLNSSTKVLPNIATEKPIEDEAIEKLKEAAVKLMGYAPSEDVKKELVLENDLQIEKTGLCWRPVSSSGMPILSKVDEKRLGGVKTTNDGGVWIAAGHGPWGISLSLGTGKVVAEMVVGKKPSADIQALGIF